MVVKALTLQLLFKTRPTTPEYNEAKDLTSASAERRNSFKVWNIKWNYKSKPEQ